MADRTVADAEEQVPEIPEVLEQVLFYTLDEAKGKLQDGEDVVPFTALVVGENLFVENHPADDVEKCFNLAKHTVEGAAGAKAYAFCYDGYVDTDEGQKDALIAEGGTPGEPQGFAIGLFYEQKEDGTPETDGEPLYLGAAPNFMWKLVARSDETTKEAAVPSEEAGE